MTASRNLPLRELVPIAGNTNGTLSVWLGAVHGLSYLGRTPNCSEVYHPTTPFHPLGEPPPHTLQVRLVCPGVCAQAQLKPPDPLQTPGVARNGLPAGGGGGRCGGDCKGISRQTVVPSTDASKENTCEATFALMPMCFIQHKFY